MTRRAGVLLLAAALTAAAGSAAGAQTRRSAFPEPGARVRVTLWMDSADVHRSTPEYFPRQVAGRLVSLGADTIHLRARGDSTTRIAARRVSSLDVGDPGWCVASRTRRTACLALGAAAGYGVGRWWGNRWERNARRDCRTLDLACDDVDWRGGRAFRLSLALVPGLAAGAYFGRERWRRVPGWPSREE